MAEIEKVIDPPPPPPPAPTHNAETAATTAKSGRTLAQSETKQHATESVDHTLRKSDEVVAGDAEQEQEQEKDAESLKDAQLEQMGPKRSQFTMVCYGLPNLVVTQLPPPGQAGGDKK